MNMLIGVLCEVIAAVADEEKESLMIEQVQDKFSSIVQELDRSGDGRLSWTEFQALLANDRALAALDSVNVDADTLVDMAEDRFHDEVDSKEEWTCSKCDPEVVNKAGSHTCRKCGEAKEGEMEFEEFMEMVLDLRGGQKATVENVMKLNKRFNAKYMTMNDRIKEFARKTDLIEMGIDKLLKRGGKIWVPKDHEHDRHSLIIGDADKAFGQKSMIPTSNATSTAVAQADNQAIGDPYNLPGVPVPPIMDEVVPVPPIMDLPERPMTADSLE
jgi:hypothetical protein